ncbi:MAG: hypothetical protein ABIP68_07315 [Ferruginibacter sp.]
MESWIKFKAPGVTIPIGLGIGKLVFGALNKIEWIFVFIIAISILLNFKLSFAAANILLGLCVTVLALETFWLLPILDVRASEVISGKLLPPSTLHWYFVGAEVIKLFSLILLGYLFLRNFLIK